MERTSWEGRWESDDDGLSWSLVDPSPEFEADRAAIVPFEEPNPIAAIVAEVTARLDDPAVNTIAEVKAAVLAGLAAALETGD